MLKSRILSRKREGYKTLWGKGSCKNYECVFSSGLHNRPEWFTATRVQNFLITDTVVEDTSLIRNFFRNRNLCFVKELSVLGRTMFNKSFLCLSARNSDFVTFLEKTRFLMWRYWFLYEVRNIHLHANFNNFCALHSILDYSERQRSGIWLSEIRNDNKIMIWTPKRSGNRGLSRIEMGCKEERERIWVVRMDSRKK